MISVNLFLKGYGVKNPIELALRGYTPSSFPAGSVEVEAASVLSKASQQGSLGFTQLTDLTAANGHCYEVDFHGTTHDACVNLGRLW